MSVGEKRVGGTAASLCETHRASRCENTKKRWHLELCGVVSTDTTATLRDLVLEYDRRSGAPESSFSQDYQALSLRKYRKRGFIAQQVLLLLAALAHNLMIWLKTWFIEAVEKSEAPSEKTQNAHQRYHRDAPKSGVETAQERRLGDPRKSLL